MAFAAKLMLGSLILTAGLMASVTGAAAACETTGTVRLDGIAERRADIVPSVHRQLSGIGRLALRDNCQIVITCVTDEALGADARKIRDRKCSATRAAITMFEKRAKVRSVLQKTYKMTKPKPSAEWAAGGIYITLQ